jgi:muramoyltetrapeptide carboxypeptidase
LTLKGHVLRPGGTIGVPAPASAYHNRSEVLRGVEWWERQGYKVKLGRNIFARDAYVAGSPEGRAQDLMDMFTDDEVDVVHCFQGGYGSAQTIEHLDFDAIRANPKALIGYSDITALHTALRHYTGLVTFYGPGRRQRQGDQEVHPGAPAQGAHHGGTPGRSAARPGERLHTVARGWNGNRGPGGGLPVAAVPGHRDAVAA